MKKAKIFQVQAVELLDSIITNPQLGDVTGSIEGSFDTRLFSDAESGLIADIKEPRPAVQYKTTELSQGCDYQSTTLAQHLLARAGLCLLRE